MIFNGSLWASVLGCWCFMIELVIPSASYTRTLATRWSEWPSRDDTPTWWEVWRFSCLVAELPDADRIPAGYQRLRHSFVYCNLNIIVFTTWRLPLITLPRPRLYFLWPVKCDSLIDLDWVGKLACLLSFLSDYLGARGASINQTEQGLWLSSCLSVRSSVQEPFRWRIWRPAP